jgi:diguanylate cyclase (GGDEF)-like protein/PAS domain S-box-containing protein
VGPALANEIGQLIADTTTVSTERLDAQQESRRLADIVRCSDDAIFSVTIEGVIQTWNAGAERIYGYSAAETLGKSVRILSSSDRAHETDEIRAKWISGREIRNLELVRVRKDGRQIVIQLTISPTTDSAGNVIGASTIARDITAKKHSDAALRQSEEQYRLLFESNPVPMWVHDRKTLRFVAVNRAAIRQYGFTEQEFLAKTITDIRSEEDIPDLLQHLAGLTEGLQEPEYWKHRKKNGTVLDVEIVRHPLDFQGTDCILVAAYDVTERKRSEEMLQNSESKYRVLFEDSGDATWLNDEKGILDCNSAALQMFGYSSSALMPHPADMSPPNQSDGTPSRTAAERKIAATFLNGRQRFEWLHQRNNGEVFPAEVCLTALTLSGRPVLLATVRDITERKREEAALSFKNALLEAQAETTLDGILVVDEADRIVLANKQFRLSFGIPEDLLCTRDDLILRKYTMDRVVDPDAFEERIRHLNGSRDEKSRDELRLKNGKIFDRYSAPLIDSKGQYRGRIWYHRDITDRKAAEERIQFLAYHDSLTELPDRVLLQDRLDNALAGARRRNEKLALLFLDLDRFKTINDSLGHAFGDRVLKEVAKRLKTCTRKSNTVARVGGDEFLIMLNSVKDAADAAIAAERIMGAMNTSFLVQGHSLSMGCSIGVSMFPEHGADGETLITNADAAMYSAKEGGRGSVRFFTDEMNAQAVERLTIGKNLRMALDKDELFLEYQPQMEIETGRITGFEALIRWRHPKLGLVPPDRFIPIAENNGLILPIGEWVLRTACAQARKWQDDGLPAVPVAVNVSAVQFRQESFCALIRRVLQETGLAPQYLELELTEGFLLADGDATLSVLQELKEMGLNLAIDDFGTGYSSLSYLKQFPVGKLKIDRSFVRDIAVDCDDRAITSAIVSMAKSLHLRVIAEGVENEAQMSFLREHRCDEIQGYYFSKPLSADDVAVKLQCGPYYEVGAVPLADSTHPNAVLRC